MNDPQRCPDCQASQFTRRQFVKATSTVAAAAALPRISLAKTGGKKKLPSESLVKKLYDSFTSEQKSEICFAWDYADDRGLLRTHVSNNWNITDTEFNVVGEFFTKDQQELIEAIFLKLYDPDWHQRIGKQLVFVLIVELHAQRASIL